jgi:hypothetical protein
MSFSTTQRSSIFRINGFGFRSPESDAFKSELSYDAEFRDSTVSNGDPYAAEFPIFQGDMKILEPERGISGRYTFDFGGCGNCGRLPKSLRAKGVYLCASEKLKKCTWERHRSSAVSEKQSHSLPG